MADIFEALTEIAKSQKEETERAVQTEENQVCIKADSYIAKEIKYQTALLHQLSNELMELSYLEKKEKRKSWLRESEGEPEKYVLGPELRRQMHDESLRGAKTMEKTRAALTLSSLNTVLIVVIILVLIKIILFI